MAIWDDVISADEQREYEKAGWGGKVGFGQRPALMVVDMYRAFVDPDYPYSSATATATASNIALALEAFRRAGHPVIFTTAGPAANAADRGRWKTAALGGKQMARPEAYEIWPEIAPRPGENVIVKTYRLRPKFPREPELRLNSDSRCTFWLQGQMPVSGVNG